MATGVFNHTPPEFGPEFANRHGIERAQARQSFNDNRYQVEALFKDGWYATAEADDLVAALRRIVRDHNEYVWARKPKNASHYHL